MTEQERKELGEKIRRDKVRLVHEFRQMIVDIQAWNDLHPDEEPIDCEFETVALARMVESLAAWDAGDTVRSNEITSEWLRTCGADP